jgi:hypothetical protein
MWRPICAANSSRTLRNRNKTAVMEKLYQANPIDVPNVLLESQIRDMQIEAMRRAGAKDASQAPPREPWWNRRAAAWRSGLLAQRHHPPREPRAGSRAVECAAG